MVQRLLLSLALTLGQTDSPPAEAPPEPPPAVTPASPDRWLLMKSLQGTWAGWLLDGNRVQVYGWTEGSFTASSAAHKQLPMGFNYRANELHVQRNWLRIERPVVTSGTTEPTFGFRSDTILPSIDYRFTISRGLFSGQLTANDGEPNTYGIDPVQFYAEAYFPTIARGLDVNVDRIFCQYGAETIDAPPNAPASHSYTFINDPFTHTGVMATAQLTPAWSVQLGIIMGPDVFIDPAARRTACSASSGPRPTGATASSSRGCSARGASTWPSSSTTRTSSTCSSRTRSIRG